MIGGKWVESWYFRTSGNIAPRVDAVDNIYDPFAILPNFANVNAGFQWLPLPCVSCS